MGITVVTASDGGWVDDAVHGLQSGDVYVSPDVSGAASLQQALQQAIPTGTSIGVAVLPKDAALGTPYSTYLLDQVFARSHYDTVIVAIGTDLQADSHAIAGTEAMRIANESEASAAGDVKAGLTQTVQTIAHQTPAHASDAGGAAWVAPVVIAVAAVAAAGGVVAAVRRRRKGTGATGLPPRIRGLVDRLRGLRAAYVRIAGNPDAARAASDIDTLVSNATQLFARLGAKAGADERTRAEGEYTDKLARLVAALEPDYLLDLITHPELWDEPHGRIAEVQEATAAVSTQLVENIKQVNARKALRFQVSLDSLVGRAELRDWEREFKRASDDA